MISKLKELLTEKISFLKGEWIKNNSSYDGDICQILEMKEDTVRYWDANWKGLNIEFKKGNSIWLDLVRYSEIVLKSNINSQKETFTLFFIPNDNKTEILEIIGVHTKDLITKVNLSSEIAKQLVALHSKVPRSLNAQTSLTKNDVRKIATFIVNKKELT